MWYICINVNSKQYGLSMDQEKWKLWGPNILERWRFFDKILDIKAMAPKRPNDFSVFTLPNYDSSHYLNITVYLAVMLQAPLHTKKFTFQLCYKLLVILQNLTESKKFHKSSHDGLLKNNILGKVSDAISVSTILKNKLYQHKVPVLPICSIYPTLNKVWILLKNGVTFTHFLVSAIKNNSDKPN